MVSSAGAYRCVALDHVGFELTTTPGLIEQGRKKYAALLRHHARKCSASAHLPTLAQAA